MALSSPLNDLLAVIVFVAAAFLVASGVAKLPHPGVASEALTAAGLPGGAFVVRGMGVGEVSVGILALTLPSPATRVAVGSAYLLFAGFLGFLLLARPGASSCGCTGARRVPPNPLHLVLNLVVVAACAAGAVMTVPTVPAILRDLGLWSGPFVIGLALLGYLSHAAVTLLPAAFGSYRRPPRNEHAETSEERHRRAEEALSLAGVGPGHPSLWQGAGN